MALSFPPVISVATDAFPTLEFVSFLVRLLCVSVCVFVGNVSFQKREKNLSHNQCNTNGQGFVFLGLHYINVFILTLNVDHLAPVCNECAILLKNWLVGMIVFVCACSIES